MNKLQMLQKMKAKHGSQILIFFRNGNNYEAYYSDAEIVSKTLGVELVCTDSIPTVSITRDEVDKILDAGYGITLSQLMDKDGNFTPAILEEEETLHLYDD